MYALLRVQMPHYVKFSWPFRYLDGGEGYNAVVAVPTSDVDIFKDDPLHKTCTFSDASHLLKPSAVIDSQLRPQLVLSDDPLYTYDIVTVN